LHSLIPLKWTSTTVPLLPYIKTENKVDIADYYSDITESSIVEGLKITTEYFGIPVCELPNWISTEQYPTDPLETLNNGDIVPEEVINLYHKNIVN
jgi:hypothetical protein